MTIKFVDKSRAREKYHEVLFITATGAELYFGELWFHDCTKEWLYIPSEDVDLNLTSLTQIIAKIKELQCISNLMA